MKKIATILMMTLLFINFATLQTASAQCNTSYTYWAVPFNMVNFVGDVLPLNYDDEFSFVIPLGFAFNFYGNSYSSILISSNGYLSFNIANAQTYSQWPMTTLPSTSTSLVNSIFGCWQDLFHPAGGSITFATMGAPSQRKFVVWFDAVPLFSCTNLHYSGQIILYEGSNNIEIQIENKEICIGWNGGGAVEGIENSTGTAALFIPGRNGTQWTATHEGWLFTPNINGPSANFATNIDSTNMTMDLHNYSSGLAPLSYYWSWGDGNNDYTQMPSHIYSALGTYNICLTVTDSNNCTSTFCDTVNLSFTTVNVDTVTIFCNANFVVYPDTFMAHHYWVVNTASGHPAMNYYWTWGDGNYDTIPYPTHTYATAGFYDICLSITDSWGCSSTLCDSTNILRTANTMVYVNVISPMQVGIKEQDLGSALYVYPNPANTTLSIHQSTFKPNQQITITDVLGNKIYSQLLPNTTESTIDITNLSNGIYFYEVNGKRGKIVKQ